MIAPRKLWYLLTPDERFSAVVLSGLMLIAMVLEMLGIGLIIPALTVMGNGDLAARYPELELWLNRIGNPTHEQLVIGGMLTITMVHGVKFLFLAFIAWQQTSFVFGLQASLSQRLFSGYLRQPYTFHLQRNSAQLIRNIAGEVCVLTSGIQSIIILITETLVLLGITSLLFIVEPFGTFLVVITFALAGGGFHHLTRHRILRWGEARQIHDGMSFQHLQQGLGGVKEVKLLGREDDFLAQYQPHNIGCARVCQRQATLQALPRLWLELIAMVGLTAVVLVMIGQGRPLEALMPTLGLFATAAFRLMPSANRLIGAVQNMRYALPVINTLHSELSQFNAAPRSKGGHVLPFNHAIALEHVSFHYPAAETCSLREVNLLISRGASVGFVGQSGAGKSTLVDIILGLLTPDSGSVTIDGIDIQSNLRGWQDQIGYVPQVIFLTDDTIRRNVAFGLPNDQIDEAAVLKALRDAQLDEFVNSLPQGLDTLVGERGVRLSGGQRQRIGIARALYRDPPVLVLDEATSSLDTATEQGVMDAVIALQGNKTLFIVAHRFSTVEHCDRLFRMGQGRVVEDLKWGRCLGEARLSAKQASQ